MGKHALLEESPQKRALSYTLGIVASAIVLATLVTIGVLTVAGIVSFIELIAVILGILYAGYELITNVIARKNVKPTIQYVTPDK